MKVLHIISDLSVGGAEMMLFKLLSGRHVAHYVPTVISLGRRSNLDGAVEDLSVPVHNIGMSPSRIPTPSQLGKLLALVREVNPDLIHAWMYHGSLAAELALFISRQRTPVVWNLHSCNDDLTLEKRMTASIIRLCRRLSRRPSKIIYVSEAGRQKHEAMGFASENSCVIHNGFDVSRFVPSTEARASVRAELGIAEDQLLIGLIGRFHPMKDHINFLMAAGRLSKDYRAAHFMLVGREVNSANQVLGDLIAKYGLQDRTHLLGERADIPRLIAASDISSLSSSYGESFPLVVGEAMSCGIPCVVTDVGDSAKLVGQTGLVVPPRDPEALARAWSQLLYVGADGRAELGEAARE
ncbi:MAG TPA: glycosyltransferase, partial [Pyrinomonadaceae bacterium]|nr:glycosyltransferase [Pyrinomonadaceae bacterium]